MLFHTYSTTSPCTTSACWTPASHRWRTRLATQDMKKMKMETLATTMNGISHSFLVSFVVFCVFSP